MQSLLKAQRSYTLQKFLRGCQLAACSQKCIKTRIYGIHEAGQTVRQTSAKCIWSSPHLKQHVWRSFHSSQTQFNKSLPLIHVVEIEIFHFIHSLVRIKHQNLDYTFVHWRSFYVICHFPGYHGDRSHLAWKITNGAIFLLKADGVYFNISFKTLELKAGFSTPLSLNSYFPIEIWVYCSVPV